MSQDWYLIKPPRVYNSGFEKDEFTDYATEGFEELLMTSPLSIDVTIYNDTVFQDGFETEVIIQNVTTDNVNNDKVRQILCRIGTLKAGMFIEYKKRYWLVITLPDDNKMYEKAIMMCCNHYLQWRNDDGVIVGRNCIVEDGTKYSVGEKSNISNIILGDTRINIRIPRDEETLRFQSGKRFLISNTIHSPTAYKLTIFDDVTDYYGTSGIVNLICTESTFNAETDNKELMIADYYTNTVTYKLELLNHNPSTPLSLNTGDTFALQVLATRNGETCNQSDILYHSSDGSIAIVDASGGVQAVTQGTCEITIKYNTETIVLAVNVDSVAVEDTYTISLIDDDNDTDIIYGDPNDVVVKIYKNGVEDSSVQFEYELFNASGIAQILKVVGNTITIFALSISKNVNKTFDLRVWNTEFDIEAILTFKVVGYF